MHNLKVKIEGPMCLCATSHHLSWLGRNRKTCGLLINRLLFPISLHNISQVTRRAMLESVAFIKLVSKLKVNGHDNVSFRSWHLFIDSEDQFPRASRDGIVSCDCEHGNFIPILPMRD